MSLFTARGTIKREFLPEYFEAGGLWVERKSATVFREVIRCQRRRSFRNSAKGVDRSSEIMTYIGPFHLLYAPPSAVEGVGIPRGREGYVALISKWVGLSVSLIFQQNGPFFMYRHSHLPYPEGVTS